MEQNSGISDLKRIFPREANKALNAILSLIKEKNIQTVIAGWPLGAQQQITPQYKEVEKFCRRIERRFPIKIHYVDEYLSSVEALEQNSKKNKRIDDAAAEIILKRFLAIKGV